MLVVYVVNIGGPLVQPLAATVGRDARQNNQVLVIRENIVGLDQRGANIGLVLGVDPVHHVADGAAGGGRGRSLPNRVEWAGEKLVHSAANWMSTVECDPLEKFATR